MKAAERNFVSARRKETLFKAEPRNSISRRRDLWRLHTGEVIRYLFPELPGEHRVDVRVCCLGQVWLRWHGARRQYQFYANTISPQGRMARLKNDSGKETVFVNAR